MKIITQKEVDIMNSIEEMKDDKFWIIHLPETEYIPKMKEILKSVEKSSEKIGYICFNKLYSDVIEELDKEALIYIKAYKNSENRWLIQSLLDCDFESIQEKKEFILQSEKKGQFYALHYRLTGVEHIDLTPIKSEISAISRFATHLTKKLEEELWEINGVIEITDRTAEVVKGAGQKK